MANLTLPLEGKKADLTGYLINNQRSGIEIGRFLISGDLCRQLH